MPSSSRPFVRRTLVAASAFTLLLSLQSCCTMLLWGYEQKCVDGDDEDDVEYVAIEGTRWEWWRVLLRIAATPVTLVADLGLCACEEVLTLSWLDDDHNDRSDAHCGSWQGGPSATRPAPPWQPKASAPSAVSGTVQRRPRRPRSGNRTRSRHRRRACAAVMFAALPSLSGCCTTALWGCTAGDSMMVSEARRKEGKGNEVFDSHADWSMLQIGKRVVLTPLALGLDAITWPEQMMWLVVGPPPHRQPRKAAPDAATQVAQR